jgi:nitrite reductase/ring-hydroxylating ferredoxin subunit
MFTTTVQGLTTVRAKATTRATRRRRNGGGVTAPMVIMKEKNESQVTSVGDWKTIGGRVVERTRGSLIVVKADATSASSGSESFSKVCAVDDLPRGDRKLVRALGKSILMFWYRDNVFAIESRSPAEGAYSEGFEKARLTQDACIECPTTKSKFDLKTGAIKEWYPDNPVLRRLTPQDTCRPMEVFPVEVRDDGIYIDAKNGSLGPDFVAPIGLGGSNTSLENNNVFAVETPIYVAGEEDGADASSAGASSSKMDASQLGGLVAIAGVVAVAGTGACLYFENYIALGTLWIAGFAGAAAIALKTTGALDE